MNYQRTLKIYVVIFLCFCGLVWSNNITDSSQSTKAPIWVHPANCKPHESVIEVDPALHRYFPYHIKMQRCHGSDKQPIGHHCMPVASEEARINVKNIAENSWTSVVVENHTACTFKCKGNASLCNQYEKWDTDDCSCQCASINPNCGANRYWSNSKCNCVCNVQCPGGIVNQEDSCKCYVDQQKVCGIDRKCPNNGLKTGTVILLIVIELFVVVLVCIIGFRCWYMNKKASVATLDDEAKLTDRDILGRYDDTMT